MINKKMPDYWIKLTIGDTADYLNGRAFKPSEWEMKGLPIIRIQNLNNPSASFNHTSGHFKQCYKIDAGDLLFSWSASLGVYIWKGSEAWLNQHIFKVIPHEYIIKKYLYYYLQNTIAEFYNKTHGSGMVHITKKKFEATSFLLPPLPEQRAIVSKIEQLFSDLDNGIDNFKKAQAQLKLYRQSVLKAACEGKLVPTEAELARAEGRDYEAADVLLARILKERREKWNGKGKYKEPAAVDTSKLSELPEGWGWANVKQVGDINEQAVLTGPFGSNLGREDFIESGVPVLTIGCLTKQGLSLKKAFYISDKKASELERYKVRSKDILFSRMATVGRADFVSTQFEGAIINYHLMRLRLAAVVINPIYFISYVRGSKTVVEYVKEVNHGATRDGINTGQLLALPIEDIQLALKSTTFNLTNYFCP